MPFIDRHKVLKPYLLKTDPKPTKLLLGEDHQSVLILRSLVKFGALLAAGVVIATSIVLKDVPLICINLLLTTVILGFQIYKIIVDDEERLRLVIELLLILGAAGVATWIAYPLLMGGAITYLTILIFANYIATVANIATYISGFFSPFIVSCMEGIVIWLGIKTKSNRNKFAVDEKTHLVLIQGIINNYLKSPNKELSTKNLVTALNNAISWLDEKLKIVQSYFFSSEIYSDKISTFKRLIRETRKGDLGSILPMLQRKRSSRVTKILIARKIKGDADQLFSMVDLKNADTKEIDKLNKFLKLYTRLSPISSAEIKKANSDKIKIRQVSLTQALADAEEYHRIKFDIFDQLLRGFTDIGIGEKPSITLPDSHKEEKFSK